MPSKINNITLERQDTPCRFNDGITHHEFCSIALRASKRIDRIKRISFDRTMIYCTVESQSGCSEWCFRTDFNDWGHVTGTYWTYTDNEDSNIPHHFGHMVSAEIWNLLQERSVILPEYSDIVGGNDDLGNVSNLSYSLKLSVLEKLFPNKYSIVLKFDSQDLLNEHLYFVVSALKSNGIKNVKCIAVKDIDAISNKYVNEVEQVVINGISFFEKGDVFPVDAQAIVTYHKKQRIEMPCDMRYFRGKNHNEVLNYLHRMGFANISECKVEDLIAGWLIKDGSVAEILIKSGHSNKQIEKGHRYEYDAKITIKYHTFKHF